MGHPSLLFAMIQIVLLFCECFSILYTLNILKYDKDNYYTTQLNNISYNTLTISPTRTSIYHVLFKTLKKRFYSYEMRTLALFLIENYLGTKENTKPKGTYQNQNMKNNTGAYDVTLVTF